MIQSTGSKLVAMIKDLIVVRSTAMADGLERQSAPAIIGGYFSFMSDCSASSAGNRALSRKI